MAHNQTLNKLGQTEEARGLKWTGRQRNTGATDLGSRACRTCVWELYYTCAVIPRCSQSDVFLDWRHSLRTQFIFELLWSIPVSWRWCLTDYCCVHAESILILLLFISLSVIRDITHFVEASTNSGKVKPTETCCLQYWPLISVFFLVLLFPFFPSHCFVLFFFPFTLCFFLSAAAFFQRRKETPRFRDLLLMLICDRWSSWALIWSYLRCDRAEHLLSWLMKRDPSDNRPPFSNHDAQGQFRSVH